MSNVWDVNVVMLRYCVACMMQWVEYPCRCARVLCYVLQEVTDGMGRGEREGGATPLAPYLEKSYVLGMTTRKVPPRRC